VSKPLLYHYFPNKRELFEAALAQAAEEHLARVQSDPDAPPAQQLNSSLDAYLSWVDEHRGAYEKLMRSAGIPEVRELIDHIREDTAQRILAGLSPDGQPRPHVRAAVRGWLWYMDGVCLDWVKEQDMQRSDVHGLLVGQPPRGADRGVLRRGRAAQLTCGATGQASRLASPRCSRGRARPPMRRRGQRAAAAAAASASARWTRETSGSSAGRWRALGMHAARRPVAPHVS
jgi:AcrR family transcriptional regulator